MPLPCCAHCRGPCMVWLVTARGPGAWTWTAAPESLLQPLLLGTAAALLRAPPPRPPACPLSGQEVLRGCSELKAPPAPKPALLGLPYSAEPVPSAGNNCPPGTRQGLQLALCDPAQPPYLASHTLSEGHLLLFCHVLGYHGALATLSPETVTGGWCLAARPGSSTGSPAMPPPGPEDLGATAQSCFSRKRPTLHTEQMPPSKASLGLQGGHVARDGHKGLPRNAFFCLHYQADKLKSGEPGPSQQPCEHLDG